MPLIDASRLLNVVNAAFDGATVAKARASVQQGCVLNYKTTGTETALHVNSRFVGSSVKTLEVAVEVLWQGGTFKVGSSCSCSLGYACEHVAAALLQTVEDQIRRTGTLPLELLPAEITPVTHVHPARTPTQPRLDSHLESWLAQLQRVASATAESNSGSAVKVETPDPPERILYVLKPAASRLVIELSVARRLKTGGYGQSRKYSLNNLVYNYSPPHFARPVDMEIARKIMVAQPSFNAYENILQGVAGAAILKELLATGRCHSRGTGRSHPALSLGEPRPAKPAWSVDAQGQQRPMIQVTPLVTEILPLTPPWYVDETTATCGPLEIGLPDAVAAVWLSSPAVSAQQASILSTELPNRIGTVALPAPQRIEIETVNGVAPVPCLRLYSRKLRKYSFGSKWRYEEQIGEDVNFAHLEFDYAGIRLEPNESNEIFEQFVDGRLRQVHRDLFAEDQAERALIQGGLGLAADKLYEHQLGDLGDELTASAPEAWLEFVRVRLPKLRKKGWRIEIEDTFRFQLVEPEGWYTDAESETGNDWFGLELGVLVDGEKVNLLPLLLKLLQGSPQLLSAEALAQMNDKSAILVPLPDGRTLPFPGARARQILGVLLELLDPKSLNDRGRLRLNKLRVAELAGEADWRWLGQQELQAMSRRLRNFDGIKPVSPSPDLAATLRPYQQEGLNWLQFLREYGLAGILADDMGLGKTVQALAHLLIEKESGRMDRPSLVIAPTSLMTNWRQEAERFAPSLKVLVLHGMDRKQHFDRIQEHDLIITSYPLLPRDQEMLLQREFHCVLLDEAQFIKNPKTIWAQIACQLRARHHLCLTGTPMENHLGELWSLFHFLLPGFLGDEIRFNSLFRRPIEKGRNDERRRLLARRVAPFILRRRKEQVVTELPPKTEIAQNVELGAAQRDLYESVRLAMHQRVLAEVDRKGLSRAHIIILDALLKLRQICCHPQLLKLPSAQLVNESAKLELLLDLLPQMIDEGRRILLFSQFTSMLAIIEKSLGTLKIPYVLLTGQTNDRATPVERFQKGEVPLFLISLKAGGTGLNLTAADTVIHYDPWWNPAVENQATDRAHRIGQDKKVFVYKLMTVGTVEEKIAALQARKRELVEGLLNEERRENLKLTPEDLDVLFAPLK